MGCGKQKGGAKAARSEDPPLGRGGAQRRLDRAGAQHHPPAYRASGRATRSTVGTPSGARSEHPAILDLVEEGILLRTDASDSEVFDREWRSWPQGAPDDLQVVITQDRIYLEKTS